MMTKAILIIGAGYLQIPQVKIARELGLRVLVTDRNPFAPAIGMADEYFQIDTRDWEKHARLGKELRARGDLAAVFCAAISAEYSCAVAAQSAKLPGIDPELAHRISNKAAMRQALASLMPIRASSYNSFEAAQKGTSGLSAFVVKAQDSSGSRGLTKIYQQSEFTETVFNRAKTFSLDGSVLIEEMFIATRENGIPEQSVETLWSNGHCYALNQVDRPFIDNDNYAIEIGHINPASHSNKTLEENYALIEKCGTALGFKDGILKGDIILTENGPVLLELTARLSGGFDSTHTSPLAHGTNYIRGAMRMALGESIPWEDFLPKWYRHSVAQSVFPSPGRIVSIDGIEEAKQVPGIEYVFTRSKVGDVIPPYTSCVDRPLFVVTSGDTRQEALNAAGLAIEKIKIVTESIDQ